MRVLLAHNVYQQAGGEDVVFEAEARLLEQRGHEVVRYTVDNDAVAGMSPLKTARATLWNPKTYAEIDALCRERKPDVAHFHNTFPLMSPSAYYAAKRNGVPVVQTLHNYRLVCPNALLYSGGDVCKRCLNKVFSFPAVRRRCYRGSLLATVGAAAMLSYHRIRKTWSRQVDTYIALTRFGKDIFESGGLPATRIRVKPNFLESDPGLGSGQGGFALFVGRLSREKGIRVMLDAWRLQANPIPLRVVGSGPEEGLVRAAAAETPAVEFFGHLSREKVVAEMKQAKCLILPSVWFEGFPMTLVEAAAVGLPAVASDLGALPSIVDDGRTGLLFEAGNCRDLADKVAKVTVAMRQEARLKYERSFSGDAHYNAIMGIYSANGAPTLATGP